jgi:hypothetical protein
MGLWTRTGLWLSGNATKGGGRWRGFDPASHMRLCSGLQWRSGKLGLCLKQIWDSKIVHVKNQITDYLIIRWTVVAQLQQWSKGPTWVHKPMMNISFAARKLTEWAPRTATPAVNCHLTTTHSIDKKMINKDFSLSQTLSLLSTLVS